MNTWPPTTERTQKHVTGAIIAIVAPRESSVVTVEREIDRAPKASNPVRNSFSQVQKSIRDESWWSSQER